MKIGELAKQSGLNASAIRYYETAGLLSPPHRVSGQRRYSGDALDRVLLIRFASEMGFSLDGDQDFPEGLRAALRSGRVGRSLPDGKFRKSSKQRAKRLKSLLEHLLNCRCASLNVCVQRLSLSPSLSSLRTGSKK